MSGPAWETVRADLARALAELPEDWFLILGEPVPPPGPRRGLLRRRAPVAATRYVQFRCERGTLYAECVGARGFGGDWEVDDLTHGRLLEWGWRLPGDDGAGPGYPNYWCRRPRSEAAPLADLGVGTLALLGVDPSTVTWTRDH